MKRPTTAEVRILALLPAHSKIRGPNVSQKLLSPRYRMFINDH